RAAPAAATFRDPTCPDIGIVKTASHVRATSGRSPPPSPPSTMQSGPVRSTSHGRAPPSAVAPYTQVADFLSVSSADTRLVARATATCSAAPTAALATAPVSPTA